MQDLDKTIGQLCQSLFKVKASAELARPDPQFGDYTTNIALRLSAQLKKPAGLIANQLTEALIHKLGDQAESVKVAGPGFINIRLSDRMLAELLHETLETGDNFGQNQLLHGQTVVIEHTDPNPFKEFHIGHAYSNTIGEALKRLFEVSGAKVHQVSYHGDVGLHIAMAIYGLPKTPELNKLNVQALAQAYAKGAKAFKDSLTAQKAIKEINKKIYDQSDPEVSSLYEAGKKLSFEYFNGLYKKLNTGFEKEYLESATGPAGVEIVKKHTGKVFKESEGAIIYSAEKKGLHTRVFVTSQGLPTYEAKELGLAIAKAKDYPKADSFIVITANEIDDYFRVLLAALGEIDAKLAAKIRHISHGMVRLPGGKMSSRTGDVVTLSKILEMLELSVKKVAKGKAAALEANVLGALKYAFLMHRIGGDLIFDITESVRLEGNSGPYLQYAFARASSILAKAKPADAHHSPMTMPTPAERGLIRKISQFPEVVAAAVQELLPSHICSYLFELAADFNRFYETNRVIGDPREALRLELVKAYAQTLKNGLNLLNIPAPEKM